MATGEDWLLWCRLCAKIQTIPHIEIFIKTEDKQNLVKILEQYYSLDVAEDDKLPKTVCELCYRQIQKHLEFVKSITKIQEMYSDLLSCGYESKAELFEIRRRYRVDKSGDHAAEQSDIKVGFVDLHPMFVCDVIVEDQNEKNPLDEIPLSNENAESILTNHNHFKDNMDSDSDVNHDEENDCFGDLERKVDVLDSIPSDTNEDKTLQKPERQRKCKKKLDMKLLMEDDDEDDDDTENVNKSNHENDDDYEHSENKPKSATVKQKRKKEKKQNENNNEESGDHPKQRKVRKDKMLKKLECQECPFKSWKKNDLKWHMISKHGRPVDENPKFVCPQCSKAFRNQHYLKRHMETHLPEDQRRTWPCPHCDKLFSTSDNAKIHVQHIHFNDKKFICEECGFIAKTNGSLKKHMESHLPIPKYECEQCGARIGNKYRLKLHMDTHNPDKFPCKICNLKFSSRVTLKNHLVIHSDAMPYKCDSCGRAFKLAKYLKSHLLTHTGLKHYSCKFCDRQFAHSTNCRLHMKKEHPEQLAKLDAEGGPKKTAENVPTLQALKAFAKSVPSRTADDEPPLFMF